MRKENLLIVAGLVWLVVGLNVANLGFHAIFDLDTLALPLLPPIAWTIVLVAGGIAVFAGFHMMFGGLVKKNTARIRSFEGEHANPLRFMDARGYLMMAFVMSFGFGLRVAGLVPDWFIAFFYTGLGLALAFAGASFLVNRTKGEGWSFHKRGQEA